MERLLYSSSSPTPLKPLLNRLPLFPGLGRIDPSKLHFPWSTRSEFSGVNSFSCRNENLFLPSSLPPQPVSSNSLLSLADSRDGSPPKPHFLQGIQILLSAQRKLLFHSAATIGGHAAATFEGSFFRSELLISAWTGFFAGCLHTLPALALPSRLAGAAFLVMFLVGTVAAMATYTVFIGSCTQALKKRVPRITEKLTWAASFIAIPLGLAILISQYFGFSLY